MGNKLSGGCRSALTYTALARSARRCSFVPRQGQFGGTGAVREMWATGSLAGRKPCGAVRQNLRDQIIRITDGFAKI
jgi:hypothetical protein